MHPFVAKKLAELLRKHADHSSNYTVSEQPRKKGQLENFHQWADNRPCEGAFRITSKANVVRWVVIVVWNKTDSFHLALFPESRSGTVAEIHECIDDGGEGGGCTLRWKYSPKKQDGKNPKRQAYFEEVFKSLEVLISLPNFADEIDDFYDELFLLAASRIKADVLDPDLPPMRTGFPEGKLKERLHRYRERNSEVVRQAKQKAMQRDGGLYCMVCKFNFADAYGPTGGDFIEAHHTTPVSMLHPEGETTKVEDIALVCSNCHSMLHRKRPWLEMHELGSLLKVAKNRA